MANDQADLQKLDETPNADKLSDEEKSQNDKKRSELQRNIVTNFKLGLKLHIWDFWCLILKIEFSHINISANMKKPKMRKPLWNTRSEKNFKLFL